MSKKILIIEDDKFLGDVLTQKLKNEGYEVVLAQDGQEGFEKIKSFLPDLILLDIILPNKNGYEILEDKQKDKDIADIPVIIVSNSGQPVEINRALSLGVKDYLVKAQFDPDEVLLKVRVQLLNENKIGSENININSEKNETVSLKGKKVLWVEDDQFLNDILARKLSTIECTSFHASEGTGALEIINKEMPDVVVLDIVLSGMSGFDILRKIKAEPKTKHIPVILLSNLGQEADIIKGKELGAAKFMVKATVTPNEIINEIQKIIISKEE